MNLALIYEAFLGSVYELNRVFDRQYVSVLGVITMIDHRG